MALEKRDGNLYYYRSVRDGEKVRKVYVGAGEFARISHERGIMNRAAREHERREWVKEQERLESLAAPILGLCEVAEILAHAHLVASGYRRYQGHWRKRRARST